MSSTQDQAFLVDEVVARALTLVALVKPSTLAQDTTTSGKILVPRSALTALRDACEDAFPGGLERVRGVLEQNGRVTGE